MTGLSSGREGDGHTRGIGTGHRSLRVSGEWIQSKRFLGPLTFI